MGTASMLDDHWQTMSHGTGTQSMNNLAGYAMDSSRACYSVRKYFGRNIRAAVLAGTCYGE